MYCLVNQGGEAEQLRTRERRRRKPQFLIFVSEIQFKAKQLRTRERRRRKPEFLIFVPNKQSLLCLKYSLDGDN